MALHVGTGEFARALCEALGLPKNTMSFDLHVEVNELVTVTAVIAPDFRTDSVVKLFKRFDIVERAEETSPG